MSTPNRRYPVAQPDIGDLEVAYVTEAVRSGWVSSIGSFVDRFEADLARFCETEHAVALSNGTDAVFLGLKALGVRPGDEVLVPALTFAAVPAVVVHRGAQPVLVDVDPVTGCIDPVAVERALSPKVKAVVAVHLYGHPADMDAILAVTEPAGVPVLEDAAEAHGARVRGRRVGGIGAAAAFSFYGNKVFTTGEGGAITTGDAELAGRVRFLKDHAMDPARRYYHTEAGHNCRMTNLQAALGCAQLERVEALLAARRRVLDAYVRAWGEDERIAFNPAAPWAEPVVWMVCARLAPDANIDRDALLARLADLGVDTRPFFVPLPDLPPYAACRVVGRDGEGAPAARALAGRGFNLPSGYGLGGDDVAVIVDRLRQALS